MNMINKRRSGDENIGKLIVFAITIVIAIGLVGLVSYFYTQSREQAVTNGVLGSTAAKSDEIQQVIKKYQSACDTASASGATISYNAIAGTYTLTGLTTPANCQVSNVRGIKGTNDSYTIE